MRLPPFLQMEKCRPRSLFPWDVPSDWDFVECLLGTVYWCNEVCCGIQSSSWPGPISPASLPTALVSTISLDLWVYVLLLSPLFLLLQAQQHSGPRLFSAWTFVFIHFLRLSASAQTPSSWWDLTFSTSVSFYLSSVFLCWMQASWGSGLMLFSTVSSVPATVPDL